MSKELSNGAGLVAAVVMKSIMSIGMGVVPLLAIEEGIESVLVSVKEVRVNFSKKEIAERYLELSPCPKCKVPEFVIKNGNIHCWNCGDLLYISKSNKDASDAANNEAMRANDAEGY